MTHIIILIILINRITLLFLTLFKKRLIIKNKDIYYNELSCPVLIFNFYIVKNILDIKKHLYNIYIYIIKYL